MKFVNFSDINSSPVSGDIFGRAFMKGAAFMGLLLVGSGMALQAQAAPVAPPPAPVAPSAPAAPAPAAATPSTPALVAGRNVVSAKECHKLFLSAKEEGSLNGMTYSAFKAAKCQGGSGGMAVSSSVPGVAAKPENAKPTAPATAAAAPVRTAGVVFPQAVAAQFANLPAGKARMKTCVAQYNANKTNGANGGLKWIQRGGGYWSQCNAHLKAAQPAR